MLTLTALDRCDRCGAQAYHRATLPGLPSELLFCNHHYNKQKDALREHYWLVESDELPVDKAAAVSASTE